MGVDLIAILIELERDQAEATPARVVVLGVAGTVTFNAHHASSTRIFLQLDARC